MQALWCWWDSAAQRECSCHPRVFLYPTLVVAHRGGSWGGDATGEGNSRGQCEPTARCHWLQKAGVKRRATWVGAAESQARAFSPRDQKGWGFCPARKNQRPLPCQRRMDSRRNTSSLRFRVRVSWVVELGYAVAAPYKANVLFGALAVCFASARGGSFFDTKQLLSFSGPFGPLSETTLVITQRRPP